jgi:hypothetical protein
MFCQIYIKVKVTLEQATEVQGGAEVQFYSSFNLGKRRWWVINTTPRPLYPRESDQVPIL